MNRVPTREQIAEALAEVVGGDYEGFLIDAADWSVGDGIIILEGETDEGTYFRASCRVNVVNT